MSFPFGFQDADSDTALPVKIAGARIGHILSVDSQNSPIVDFEGNLFGPIVARLAAPSMVSLRALAAQQTSVVLVFENADPSRPIIIGVLQSNCSDKTKDSTNGAIVFEGDSYDIVVNGRRLRIEGREAITIQCGKGSLTICEDGKIFIRGTNITSRASQVNKIKGGAVRIN
jgi:hypothetical protein